MMKLLMKIHSAFQRRIRTRHFQVLIKKLLFLPFFMLICFSCTVDGSLNPIYRQYMRDFVRDISAYAKGINNDFVIIPQNGHELLTEDGESDGPLSSAYISAVDAVAREEVFYGYDGDDLPTPAAETDYMTEFLDIALANGLAVLVADYCLTQARVDDSYAQSFARGYISFAADHRELDNIPDYPAAPYNENNNDIAGLDQAKNFLYIINPSAFANVTDFINAVAGTNYDVVVVDLFYEDVELTPAQVAQLKTKAGGGSRLVIAYMSIGEAEDFRYYWQPDWDVHPPSWLREENSEWPGCYLVEYWDSAWQSIIYGNDGSYLKKILDAGFDGVYLDIIEAYEYFE
ncbi:MAG: endo alpha-1,4 polygalactosaminidase [Spirochaetales bacterium]|nr:endo alpha-1,4 polygalactosaminidase [Spirochaetales bacterium]